MTLVGTDLLAQISGASGNAGTGAFVTNTFTPSDGALLVVAVGGMENGGSDVFLTDLTISGGGLTFTAQQSASADTAFSIGQRIYTAPVAVGASMALTLDCGTRNMGFYTATVRQYLGHDPANPIRGKATGFQSGGFAGPPTPATITLDQAPLSTSEVVAGVTMNKATATATEGAGWTELSDVHNTTWGGGQAERRTASTSATVAWADLRPGGGALFAFAAVAVEVVAAVTVDYTGMGTLADLSGAGLYTSAAPASGVSGGSWYTLLDIYAEAAQDAAYDRDAVPEACPNDGEPLRGGPNGELYCPFDGWQYPRDWIRPGY